MQAPVSYALASSRIWIDPPGHYVPGVVVVDAGSISQVLPPEGRASLRADLPCLDLGERPLLPGLINTHVHLEFSASSSPLREFEQETATERLLRAMHNARVLLESGVTTVRDCGSSMDLLALARRSELHPLPLPRLVMSGAPITVPQGHLHMMGGEADSIAGIDAVIERNLLAGAQSIKLMGSGGGMTPGTAPENPAFPQVAFDHVAARAREHGLPSVVHVLAPESIRRGALARFDSLEHCAFFVRDSLGALERRFDPTIADIIRDSGARVMANLSTATRALDALRRQPERPAEADRQLRQFDVMLDNFGWMLSMGIRFVCGNDAGVRDTPFSDTAQELVWMGRAGMKPVEALRAATTEAAAALHMEDNIGRIAPSFSADLIAFDADPLADLTVLAAPAAVIARGNVVRAEGSLACFGENAR